MPKRREPGRLPFLAQGALLLVAARVAELPLPAALAAAALLLLAPARSGLLAPFVVAGALLAAAHGVEEAPRRVSGVVRVRGDGRPSATGGVVTWLEGVTADLGAQGRARLIEPHGVRRDAGDWLALEALLEPGGAPRNPGAPPPAPRLRDAQVAPFPGTAVLPWWARLRRAVDRGAGAIDRAWSERLSPRAAALARAFALGRDERLDAALRDDLRASGGWHLIAVSGGHVVLLVALAGCVWSPRRRFAFALLALLVLLFVVASGAQAPAWRAALAWFLAGLARGRERELDPLAVVAGAFLAFVAWQPALLDDAGFALSFAAVAALGTASRYGPSRSPRGSGHGIDLRVPLGRALRLAWFAALATAPLTACWFGSFTPVAPLATLLLAPVVTVGLATSFVAAPACLLPAELSALPCALVDCVLRGLDVALRHVAGWLGALPGTPLACRPPDRFEALLLLAAHVALRVRRPGVAALAAAALLALALPGGASGQRARGAAQLWLLDVGHGLAALLRDGGRSLLVDAGGRALRDAEPIAGALRELRVGRLDALLLSHLDADHVNGVVPLLDEVAVGEVLVGPGSAEELAGAGSGPLAELREALVRRGVALRVVAAGDRIGPHRVAWPPRDRRFAARNDGSLALVARCGEATLLLPGDLESYPLVELLAELPSELDLLVLPHHGNADPCLAALLARCRTALAFASRSTADLPCASERALAEALVPWRSTARSGALRWAPAH